MKNRFNLNEEEKNRIRGLHDIKLISEQWSEVEMEETVEEKQFDTEEVEGLDEQDPNGGNGDIGDSEDGVQSLDEQGENFIDSESHEKFMTELCGMDIVAMGDKMIGRRKCDGNKTDGSGGCYEPLIKLVKEYCKTK